jgi:NAD(P)-dependent dehydrogenase (short-subunit alcohol dehydrogenase family)
MQAVVITGCSSGIGRVTALRLQRAGFAVYATRET